MMFLEHKKNFFVEGLLELFFLFISHSLRCVIIEIASAPLKMSSYLMVEPLLVRSNMILPRILTPILTSRLLLVKMCKLQETTVVVLHMRFIP